MNHIGVITKLMMDEPLRRKALEAVSALELTDSWIGAGFVRDAVWDHLHGHDVAAPNGDIDVVWFDVGSAQAEFDRHAEHELHDAMPGLHWSVKNQARMHLRNGDMPYTSVADAMRHWPETATAVAVRLDSSGAIEINAPLGLDDLFALRLRPTSNFLAVKRPIFIDRISSKRWIERYPRLLIEA